MEAATKFTLPELGDPLSKNSLKKKLKEERLAKLKVEKKARKRERKMMNKSYGESPDEDTSSLKEPEKKRQKLDKITDKFDATVIIDLGFDSLMFEKVSRAYPISSRMKC